MTCHTMTSREISDHLQSFFIIIFPARISTFFSFSSSTSRQSEPGNGLTLHISYLALFDVFYLAKYMHPFATLSMTVLLSAHQNRLKNRKRHAKQRIESSSWSCCDLMCTHNSQFTMRMISTKIKCTFQSLAETLFGCACCRKNSVLSCAVPRVSFFRSVFFIRNTVVSTTASERMLILSNLACTGA